MYNARNDDERPKLDTVTRMFTRATGQGVRQRSSYPRGHKDHPDVEVQKGRASETAAQADGDGQGQPRMLAARRSKRRCATRCRQQRAAATVSEAMGPENRKQGAPDVVLGLPARGTRGSGSIYLLCMYRDAGWCHQIYLTMQADVTQQRAQAVMRGEITL